MQFSEKAASKWIKSTLALARDHAIDYKGLKRDRLVVGMFLRAQIVQVEGVLALMPPCSRILGGKGRVRSQAGRHQGTGPTGNQATPLREAECAVEGREDTGGKDGDQVQERFGQGKERGDAERGWEIAPQGDQRMDVVRICRSIHRCLVVPICGGLARAILCIPALIQVLSKTNSYFELTLQMSMNSGFSDAPPTRNPSISAAVAFPHTSAERFDNGADPHPIRHNSSR